MSKPAIICVDDDPANLESLKNELKQVLGDGYFIQTAENGEVAFKLFKELQIDKHEVALVLVDQRMPGMQGDELLELIHTLSPQTLNILMVGHDDLSPLNKAIHMAWVHRHIAKPWHSSDLQAIILEAIQTYYHIHKLELQNAKLQQTVQNLEQSIAQLKQSEEQLWQQTQQQEALNRVFLAFAVQQFQHCQATQMQVEELEYLNQLKDNFLNAVSHELRSPISNIRMATQMLEVRLQQLEGYDTLDQCDRYFQILRSECQRETDLLNDLLALIRLDSGSDPLNVSAINLNLWLPHIAEPFIERMKEREQHFQINLPAALPTITTDLSHLERTFTELLTNAWKYTPVGESITVTAQVIQLSASPADLIEQWELPESHRLAGTATISSMTQTLPQSELWLSVINSGVEIPVEEHERIFNQFYRIPSNNLWHQGGSGLGLAIVRKRVEKLQGSISVISQQNQTTFTIKLPLHFSTSNL